MDISSKEFEKRFLNKRIYTLESFKIYGKTYSNKANYLKLFEEEEVKRILYLKTAFKNLPDPISDRLIFWALQYQNDRIAWLNYN